MMEPEP